MGPIGGGLGDGCKKLKVTVSSYYSGQPRTYTDTVTLSGIPGPNDVALVSYSGTFLSSSHCGMDANKTTYGCHTFSS